MAKLVCTSCKIDITTVENSTKFPCPGCGNLIVRCGKCRKTSTPYRCENCGFVGP
ncbi:MAG: DUF1610 domain-containing protein [Nanoarchaeota archaeon]|nr:DUF1610 domain-containing protein [Nanoarchaeota archaeon]